MIGRSTEYVLVRHREKKTLQPAQVHYYFTPTSGGSNHFYLSVVNLYPSFVQVLRNTA